MMKGVDLEDLGNFLLTLHKAGFTAEMIQQMGEEQAKAMYNAVVCQQKVDPFEFVTSFEVVVPKDYNHNTCLTIFRSKHENEFYFYDPDIIDENYTGATTKLQPGQHFLVKVFGVKKGMIVSSNDCLGKISEKNGILVGAQGLSLVYEQGKDKLPKDNRKYASFDERGALWKDINSHHRVPHISAFLDGEYNFSLGHFEFESIDDYCILCFCNLPSDA